MKSPLKSNNQPGKKIKAFRNSIIKEDLPQVNLTSFYAGSENGYGFVETGLKMGVKNDMFWSQIGSGFGEPGWTPLPRIPRSTPPPSPTSGGLNLTTLQHVLLVLI